MGARSRSVQQSWLLQCCLMSQTGSNSNPVVSLSHSVILLQPFICCYPRWRTGAKVAVRCTATFGPFWAKNLPINDPFSGCFSQFTEVFLEPLLGLYSGGRMALGCRLATLGPSWSGGCSGRWSRLSLWANFAGNALSRLVSLFYCGQPSKSLQPGDLFCCPWQPRSESD